MTGLMLVFLLIVVVMQYGTLVRYENTKQEIYDALSKKFALEEKSEKLTISEDLVVRFQDTDALFEQDQALLSRYYKKTLDDFIPKYLEILSDKRFADSIREVRIEGHTGKPTRLHSDYIDLVKLSQNRARVILEYFVSSDAFRRLDARQRDVLRFRLMANGFGNGRMVDKNGKYVVDSGGQPLHTRRVEFRIMTDAEQSLAEALQPL